MRLPLASLLLAPLVLSACGNDDPPRLPDSSCTPLPPAACADDIEITSFPARIEGSTAGRPDGYGDTRCSEGGGAGVPDVAYRFTAPYAGRFVFRTAGSSFDTTLSVRVGSCGATELSCNDDVAAGDTTSSLMIELDACETVTVVIDGYFPSNVGAYVLTVDGAESSCDDGIDDDYDGLTDCDDPDCGEGRCLVDTEWPADWVAFEQGVLEAVNEVRAAGATCGGEPYPPAPPVERNAFLERSARLHSMDMLEQNYFEHESLDGRSPFDRMDDAGFTGPAPKGENIAAGQTSVQQVMTGWMNSPGHCRNIMEPGFRVLGVGYAERGRETRWTQNFGGGH